MANINFPRFWHALFLTLQQQQQQQPHKEILPLNRTIFVVAASRPLSSTLHLASSTTQIWRGTTGTNENRKDRAGWWTEWCLQLSASRTHFPGWHPWPTPSAQLTLKLLQVFVYQLVDFSTFDAFNIFSSGFLHWFGAEEETWRQPHKEAHECLHGVVTHEASPDCPRKSKDAQLWDLKEAGVWVEDTNGGGEAAVHRWGQAHPSQAHAGPSRLQIPPQEEAQEHQGPRIPLHNALPFSLNGGSESRLVQSSTFSSTKPDLENVTTICQILYM